MRVKKAIIPQPYASMIMSGSIQILKNEFGSLNLYDRIYIYATEMDKGFENGLDFTNPVHQILYNELLKGNIENKKFKTNVFLGYVYPSVSGEVLEWININRCEDYIFIRKPHILKHSIKNYNISEERLLEFETTPFFRRSIKHEIYYEKIYEESKDGWKEKIERVSELVIPISIRVWKILNKSHHYIPALCETSEVIKNIPYVSISDWENNKGLDRLKFKYKDKCLYGIFNSSPWYNYSFVEKGEPCSYTRFDLCFITDNQHVFNDISNDSFYHFGIFNDLFNPHQAFNLNDYIIEEENDYTISKKKQDKIAKLKIKEIKEEPKSQSVWAISIPMGGMNRWRRKR